MNTAYLNSPELSFFSDATDQLKTVINHLKSSDYFHCEHGEIEKYIHQQGHEILRCLFQGWLDIKTANEPHLSGLETKTGSILNHVRANKRRKISSLFGQVSVKRKGYGQRNQTSLYPVDDQLNLPKGIYSDGLRYRLSKEVIRGSFDNAIESIDETTGSFIPKRQSLHIIREVAQDFECFYQQQRFVEPEPSNDLLVLTFDGKGIVMLPNSLRECTKKAAAKSNKLNSRLSSGEKKDRKRMAQVAAVYTVVPHSRTAESIMNQSKTKSVLPFRAPCRQKRVWASVERPAETVIEEAFLEALQRDPNQQRHWVVLIDGLPHQIRLINKVMKRLDVKATLVMDFIHVLEYLWKAAWCFFDKGDKAVEKWISQRAIKILNGQTSQVAKGIRISATKQNRQNRINIDKCADYLIKNKSRLKYGEALKSGLPIASGVIEGACRHLINDRLDITGARWSLKGAEAILKLRSLKSSNDFEKYWIFHKTKEQQRNYDGLKYPNSA